jgi:hypothetical protein
MKFALNCEDLVRPELTALSSSMMSRLGPPDTSAAELLDQRTLRPNSSYPAIMSRLTDRR